MRQLIQQILLFAFVCCMAGRAGADIIGVLNSARHDCNNRTVVRLRLQKQLSTAAKKVSQGSKPADAAHAVGYEMTQLASIHLEGFNSERELQSLLQQQSCKYVGDEDARDIGYFQRGNEVWILVGASRGDPGNPIAAAKRALQLVNQAREQPRRCGDQIFAATKPLVLNSLLTQAAQAHSDEMARLLYVEHEGKDGSTPSSRVARAGYRWQVVGENVAAGEGGVDLLIADWLGSPHHCANIMDPRFSEMGLAFAINKSDRQYGVYWTQTFGVPKAR